MKYNRYTRPKLSRNKYGFVNNSNSSISYYSGGGSGSSNSSDNRFSEEDYNILLDGMSPFIGASEYEDGKKGLVPAPLAGMQDYYFLKADGSWAYDSAYAWLHEWPVGSDNPRGLEIDGDFNVTGTLSTMDLNVEGRAHFWELVIDKVKANGGQVIVSPSLFEVDYVGGTQIYEMTFDSFPSYRGPYYWQSNFTDAIPNEENYYDWTFQIKNERRVHDDTVYYSTRYGGMNFYNTTETAFTKEQFTGYALSRGLFLGKNVHWYPASMPGFYGTDLGWGSKWTGFFDRGMRDENGDYLPPNEGLPYDWDSHWMDYYNWSKSFGYIDNETTSLCVELPMFTDSHEAVDYGPVDGGQATFEGKVMTRFGRADFLNFQYHTTDDWYNIVANRPDMWYRFWATELSPIQITNVRPVEEGAVEKELDKEWADVIQDPDHPTEKWIEAPDYIEPLIHEWPVQPWQGRQIYPTRKLQYFAKRLYMRNDDGSRRILNECVVGDMMRCKSFNIKEGVYKNVENKDYWSFIIGTGEGSYTDDNGNEHSAFWIDLVYGLKVFDITYSGIGLYPTENTRYFPLGTYFNSLVVSEEDWGSEEGGYGIAGTYNVDIFDTDVEDITELPDYFTADLNRILNLTKVSKKTLTGLENVIEQYPTESEFEEAVELIYNIRGADTLIQFINSNSLHSLSSTTGLSSYSQMQKEEDVLNFINSGTLPSNPTDATNVLLYGTSAVEDIFTEVDSNENPSTLNDALILSYGILKGGADSSDLESVSAENTPNSKNWKKKVDMTMHNYCSRDYTLGYKFGYGEFDASVDDSLACLGNLFDVNRMNAIVISASAPIDPELLPPSIAQYHLIDIFGESISKFRWTTIARSGNTFYGNFNIETEDGAFMDMDSDINLYINDIYNNLELVGIHLDGPNSTIKMIGNIELHQHDDGNDDTFSVWDSEERKRVEILPREIPDRESEESLLSSRNKIYFDRQSTSYIATTEYIYYKETGSWIAGLWGNSRKATYSLNVPEPWNGYEKPRAKVRIAGTSVVGNFTRNPIPNSENSFYDFYIDVGNINFKVDISDMYLLYGGGVERNLVREFALFSGSSAVKVKTLELTLWGANIPQTVRMTPSYSVSSDGKIVNITVPTTVFNDIKIQFPTTTATQSGNVYLDYSFYVLPFAQVGDIARSDTRSFRGNAISTGDYILTTSERVPGSGQSVNALSQFMIGTNGMFFNTSNSRYFYASDDGIEMKWDDTSISVDSKDGLKLVPKVGASASRVENVDASINVIKPYYGNGYYTAILPSASDYGNGRIIYVVGQWTYIVSESQFKVAVPPVPPLIPSGGVVSGTSLSSATSFGYSDNVISLPTFGALSLISLDGFWWVMGGATYATN